MLKLKRLITCQEQLGVDLPPTFTLVIERDRFARRCRAVWSNAPRAGMAFC
jgi:hypothetical protein